MTTKTGTKRATTPAKKVVAKKTTTQKKPLTHAQPEECFWAKDGTIIKNLVELSEVLVTVPSDVFDHHVTKHKNDFADWVEHVLSDGELAQKMRSAKKPNTTRTLVLQRLKVYEV